MQHSYSAIIPDEVLRLCCMVFHRYEDAIAANPAEPGSDRLCWMVMSRLPDDFTPQAMPSIDQMMNQLRDREHSASVDCIYPNEYIWLLERAEDQEIFKLLKSEHGSF